ncbi:hypothetical protein SAMN00120144_3978 [Hymenobacter roseosalivarius DSM 11622]|uniref:Uncharacterized protein n=1 Tax=Hymenobacter roseosalivarius DSM 11622 TaxID=645990 RepID=A0A1W1UF23_9BACT|nr:hypothetical protein [Hymenobacter roseosalivarius]SMB79698.1 hypothetical protein SAMN00120144_3978 [Hymenobacter roseosalivarius DSM 11622]
METTPTGALQGENEALRAQLAAREAQLYQALGVIAGMWNQYCPPPFTHQCMNAGEDAEEVLKAWELLMPDETAIDFWGLWSRPAGVEVPSKVASLVTPSNKG